MVATTDFIGTGLSFPFAVDHTGSLALATGPEAVERSLRMILGTAPSERVMRPDFGCAIWDLLFDPITSNSLGLMADAVRSAVGRWEPRVELEEVIPRPDPNAPGVVHLELTYRLRDTNDRRNLVFPFYVIPGDEGEG
jgi:phage baseplate assembly protein W